MDWQSILAIFVALVCGVWVLGQFIRPFLSGQGGACGGGCGSKGCKGETLPAPPEDLLRIGG